MKPEKIRPSTGFEPVTSAKHRMIILHFHLQSQFKYEFYFTGTEIYPCSQSGARTTKFPREKLSFAQ